MPQQKASAVGLSWILFCEQLDFGMRPVLTFDALSSLSQGFLYGIHFFARKEHVLVLPLCQVGQMAAAFHVVLASHPPLSFSHSLQQTKLFRLQGRFFSWLRQAFTRTAQVQIAVEYNETGSGERIYSVHVCVCLSFLVQGLKSFIPVYMLCGK